MRDPASISCRSAIRLALIVVVAFTCANAQRQESFEGFMSGIRANAVQGEVIYQRTDGKFPLEPGLKLEEGDFIRSGANAYAELLLQPGNYLRLASETEFMIFNDGHDRMRLKLNRGAISFEMVARDDSNFYFSPFQINELIRVITPNAEVLILQPGIFRIDATVDGRTEVTSRDGNAVIEGYVVREKKHVVAANRHLSFSDIDAKVEDAFDSWCRERAAKQVQANKLLKKNSPWSKNPKKGKQTSIETPEREQRDNRDRVVSARPGTITFAEPGAEFVHTPNEWQQLTETSQLQAGDTLRTNAHSFVELMLLPDVYFRLGTSSEVLLDQLLNDAISVRVVRGSAILDVPRFDRKLAPRIKVGGPVTAVAVADDGNYRIDTFANADAITIREGKVTFNEQPVGACRMISGGMVMGCDKKRGDNLDVWSQHRGEGQLYNGRAYVAMASHLARFRLFRFRNAGFWFQQSGQTSYTFVPFYSLLFRSPYGGNYSTVLQRRP